MEAAGLNAAAQVLSLLAGEAGKVTVVCGTGNNGGDGLVVARHLQRHHVDVSVHMVASQKSQSPQSESSINKGIWVNNVGLPIHYFDEEAQEHLEEAVSNCAVIVDALLGTGLDRPVTGAYSEAIEIINASGKPVLSIDLPSGIHSDSGQVMGVAVQADVTCTFGYLKAGLLNYPGAGHAGIISLIDIGLPDINALPPPLNDLASSLETPTWWLATHAHVRHWLPPRPPDGHKGTFGRVLAIAGSLGMTGSCMLSSRSVLRSGAGYVVLATARSVVEHLPAEEIVYLPLSDTKYGALDTNALNELEEELRQADAVLLGPGLGGKDTTVKLVEALLSRIDRPCIVDADGLNAIAQLNLLKLKKAENFVFTPHPKELERLTGMPVAKIQADRIGAAQSAVDRFGCTIVLKGAHTVVSTPNDGTYIIPTGNSGMATPGSGDVLSGIIAALLAGGLRPPQAAVAGAYIHGAAGDLAADKLGEDGMVAHDIMDAVPLVIAEIKDGDFEGRQIEYEVLGQEF